MLLRSFVTLAAVALTPAVASAHTLMTSPQPRNDSDGLKAGPCGNVPPTATPTELVAGSTITVRWLETVDHPGYYRIAFSRVGDTGYEDNVLLDDIADSACGAPPCEYSAEVTLPDELCTGCSLQLIQFMGAAPPYSPYFSCADIALVEAAPPDAGPSDVDAGPSADAGTDEPAGGDAGLAGDEPESEMSGGCAVSSAPTSSAPWLFALAALLRSCRRSACRRRRRALR